MPCKKPVKERCSCSANMEVTCWTWCKTDFDVGIQIVFLSLKAHVFISIQVVYGIMRQLQI